MSEAVMSDELRKVLDEKFPVPQKKPVRPDAPAAEPVPAPVDAPAAVPA
jgi:hypothetical protein